MIGAMIALLVQRRMASSQGPVRRAVPRRCLDMTPSRQWPLEERRAARATRDHDRQSVTVSGMIGVFIRSPLIVMGARTAHSPVGTA